MAVKSKEELDALLTRKTPEDLEAFRLEIRKFVKELEPIAEEIERRRSPGWDCEEPEVPLTYGEDEIERRVKEKGLLKSLRAPVEWGGWGLSFSEYRPISEEVSKSYAVVRGALDRGNRTWQILARYANEEQKKRWLPALCTGAVRTVGMTEPEPDGGTGAGIKTTAKRVGDKYIINGQKHFASSCNVAQPLMIWAKTDETKGAEGVSCIIIGDMKEGPRPAGLIMKNLPPLMGPQKAYHGHLIFNNVEVPVENLLGKEGEGLDMFLDFIAESRVNIATNCLGMSQRFLDLAVDFAKKRVTFGRPIGRRQAVQTMLADMAIQVYALRAMITECTRKIDKGYREVSRAECSACKLLGIETTRITGDNCLLIHGGIGYTRRYPVERLYRESRSLWLEEGTPAIHRFVIARDLLGY